MRFDIRYRTQFEYDQLVRESQNELRSCPTSDDYQQLISYRVSTTPSSRVLSATDYWGTRVDAFGIREPHLFLEVLAEASVETRSRTLLTATAPLSALGDGEFRDRHCEYLEPTRHAVGGAGVAREAARLVDLAGDDVVSLVLAIHRYVGMALTYETGSTYVGVAVEEVLASGRGVCQDFAHLAVALCRAASVPARYVSGYLFTEDDSRGDDTTAELVRVQTHAWFEAAAPGFGWIALDPTNRQQAGLRHVKIGHGRDYDDVPPLRGVYVGSGSPQLGVEVEMRRLGRRPEPDGRARRAARRQAEQTQQQ